MKRNGTISAIALCILIMILPMCISSTVNGTVSINTEQANLPTDTSNQTIVESEPTEPIKLTESTEPIKLTESTEPIIEPTEPTTQVEKIEKVDTQQQTTTEQRSDLDILAAVIYYEAGSGECTDRHQQLVAQVVLNRVADSRYPNTVYGVVTQSGQYSTRGLILSNAGADWIPQRCYDNALLAMNGSVDCPQNVLYQANFIQGSGIYEEIYTSYSVSYFCYR